MQDVELVLYSVFSSLFVVRFPKIRDAQYPQQHNGPDENAYGLTFPPLLWEHVIDIHMFVG
jgi:hypothetical protein